MSTVGDQPEHGSGDGALQPQEMTTASQWAEGIRTLRERSGMSVRDLARATGASSSTIGGYVSGRHLPTIGATDLVVRMLVACGVTDTEQQTAWVDALARLRRHPGPRPASAPVPFKGLDAYDQSDARWFCGREALTGRLVALVESHPDGPVLVVGASGSGKSSLLRAGLAATVAARGWHTVAFTPGADPVAAVEDAARDVLDRQEGQKALVVIDQLEELWTAGAAQEQWRDAVVRLCDLAASSPEVVVVAALRADFYAHALRCHPLAEALQSNQVVLGPMARDELVRAVTLPPARAGVELEDGFVEVLLRDIAPPGRLPDGQAYEPGALPLLSFALLQTWRTRGQRMTIQDYLDAGGIDGAVAAAADRVYDGLDERGRQIARRLFLRLVAIGEDTADARRRMPHEEIDALDAGDAMAPPSTVLASSVGGAASPARGCGVADVVEAFVAARLLTAAETYVEITHEALLSAWPRLRAWLDEDRSGLLLQRSLVESASVWAKSARDPGLLLRGRRLDAAREWMAGAVDTQVLTPDEKEYFAESVAADARAATAARRRRRGLQVLSGALAVALVALAGITLSAVAMRRQAEGDRDLAQSRQLAEAANRLRALDPNLASQFALLGYRTADTVEARSALLDSTALPLGQRLVGPGGPAAVSAGNEGQLLAAVGDQGGLRLWSLPAMNAQEATGGEQAPNSRLATVREVSEGPLYAVAVHPSAPVVVTGGTDGTIRLWDVTDPARPQLSARISVEGYTVLGTVLDSAGVLAAALSSPDGTSGGVGLWALTADGAAGSPRLQARALGDVVDVGSAVQAVAFGPGGLLAAGTADGAVHRLRIVDGVATVAAPALRGPTDVVTSVAFSPDGGTLAAGSKDLRAHVWRLSAPDGEPVPPEGGVADQQQRLITGAQSWVTVVAFSRDGAQLAVGSSDSQLRIYDADTLGLLTTVGHPGPVTAAFYAQDGTALATGGADGAVRVWPLPLTVGPIAHGRTFSLGYIGADRLLAVTSRNSARLYDVSAEFGMRPVSGTASAPANEAGDRFSGSGSVSPNGRVFASGGRLGTTWLFPITGASGGPGTDRIGEPVTLPASQKDLVEATTFTPDSKIVISASDDASVVLHDVSDPTSPRAVGVPVQTDGAAFAVTVAPGGNLLAVGHGSKGAITLYDISDPADVRSIAELPQKGRPSQQVYYMAFSPDGQRLAVASADRTLRLVDVSAPSRPQWVGAPVSGPSDYLFGVQFSPDGKMVATVSGDGAIRLYDVTGEVLEPRAALTAPGRAAMYSVAFSPDGEQIAAGGAPEAVFTWPLDAQSAAGRVCSLVGDEVSEEEWRRYVASVPYSPPCGA